jgi:4-hydroxyphenylacetate 3-monooxygenase
MEVLASAQASGLVEDYKSLAEQCLNEYGLRGWTVPDLITPADVNLFLRKFM